ncbi:conserved domain protein [uncultured Candidatus Thioglobus sp.]|nr:conserved domain protein [uncultured Candidatus Thioglobus sp.]
MKDIYAWVPWFQELARKIDEGGKDYLIAQAKRINWVKDSPALLKYGDENIDPFSFIYFLAQKNTKGQREPVYRSVSEIFDISQDILSRKSQEEGFIFPTPAPNSLTLFHADVNGDPDLLWKLFKQARQGSKEINADDFANVLKIKNVGVAKLTQTLFLINTNDFMPIDEGILEFNDVLGLPFYKKAKKEIQQHGWGYYKDTMLNGFKVAFPGCSFFEINTALHLIGRWKNKKIATIGENLFQISTNVKGVGNDYWQEFSDKNHVRTGGRASEVSFADKGNPKKPYPLDEPSIGDIILVRYGKGKGYGIGVVYVNDHTPNNLTADNKIHVLWLNKSPAKLNGTTVMDGFSSVNSISETYKAFASTDAYKPTFKLIQHLGGKTGKDDKENGDNQMKHPLNQILYGPPGTGKTWNTVNHALAIIEGKSAAEFENEDRDSIKKRFDELKKTGQIEMVTFHQSFAYEDFVQGIKPVLNSDSDNVSYEISDGVFKKISNRAKENLIKFSQKTEAFDLNSLLHDFAEHINQKIAQGEIIRLFLEERYPTQITYARTLNNGKIQFRLGLGKHQTKYSISVNIILRDYTKFINSEIGSYRDIKPTHKAISAHHGDAIYLFYLMQHIKIYQDSEWQPVKQTTAKKQNYVLIIDEINRGNIAKIFGELITLIEDTKRIGNKDETTVTLPYSSNSDEDDSFGVPNNLYIIGTMNTADRSIALLDTALRRRFDFIEMMPKPNHPLISNNVGGVNCHQLLAAMNNRITALLDREHQIGHSYFIDVGSMEKLAAVFRRRIIPLLQEYFYDDWERINLVLNKNGFLTEITIDSDMLADTDLVDTERSIYELIEATSSEWTKPENYKKIYSATQMQADDDDDK